MLPAANRMRSSVDFAAAIRRGRRAGRRTLVLHYRPSVTAEDSGSIADSTAHSTGAADRVEFGGLATGEPARIGLVVSRAVGGSVVRSRVKRRLRHLMADRLAVLEPGSLLVVRASPAGAEDDDRLGKDLDSALRAVTKAVAA